MIEENVIDNTMDDDISEEERIINFFKDLGHDFDEA